MNVKKEAKRLLEDAQDLNVSDVHIMPRRKDYSVDFRVHGRLERHSLQTLSWGRRLISYFKYLADMDVGEKRQPQSGAKEFTIANTPVELRFSTITNVNLEESLVIRIIRQTLSLSQQIHTLFPQDITLLDELIYRKSGLILFSGPVGSGKTTTIYQLLRKRMDQQAVQIITMEDPVEIYDERFLQTEVSDRAEISYDRLIRASLRHHPDVLVIGEIRDEETARMTIRGALTGHLMVATIHAKDTLGVIARLQELQVSNEQLRQTLIGIISQRLVPKFCEKCQGNCQSSCQRFELTAKRSAVLEVLAGRQLEGVLRFDDRTSAFETLNGKLRKAWSYGFIDAETYREFEII